MAIQPVYMYIIHMSADCNTEGPVCIHPCFQFRRELLQNMKRDDFQIFVNIFQNIPAPNSIRIGFPALRYFLVRFSFFLIFPPGRGYIHMLTVLRRFKGRFARHSRVRSTSCGI